jgi:hypothetical protein
LKRIDQRIYVLLEAERRKVLDGEQK